MKHTLPLALSMLLASTAEATPRTGREDPRALVHAELIAPLEKSDAKRARFSRALPGPTARRVRLLPGVGHDVRGDEFVRFAIDVRRPGAEPDPWEEEALLGCVYLGKRAVYVRDGSAYVPAKHLFGAGGPAPAGVCVDAVEGKGDALGAALRLHAFAS